MLAGRQAAVVWQFWQSFENRPAVWFGFTARV
jgi:hypothetical protein